MDEHRTWYEYLVCLIDFCVKMVFLGVFINIHYIKETGYAARSATTSLTGVLRQSWLDCLLNNITKHVFFYHKWFTTITLTYFVCYGVPQFTLSLFVYYKWNVAIHSFLFVTLSLFVFYEWYTTITLTSFAYYYTLHFYK